MEEEVPKTPSSTRSSGSDACQCTPILSPITNSPAPSNVSGKSLQGYAKVIRNGIADVSNLTGTWNEKSKLSYEIFVKIIDHVGSSLEDQIPPKFTEEFDEHLDALCNELAAYLTEMDHILTKLFDVVTCIRNCEKMVKKGYMTCISPSQLGMESPILFYSWTVSQFAESSNKVVAAYQKQTALLRRLSTVIITRSTELSEDDRVIMLSSWLHQPYITDYVTSQLYLMQIEIGLEKF